MEIFEKLVEANHDRKPACFCVVIETKGAVPRRAGSKMIVYSDGTTFGTVGGGALESVTIEAAIKSLSDGRPQILQYSLDPKDKDAVGVCGGDVSVYIEPQLTQPILLILGAGHVGRSVAKFAQLLDFRVIVSDDRAELCTHEYIPGNVEFLPVLMEEIPQHLEINNTVYIVNVSRGSDVDVVGMPTLLQYDMAYFGLIGSLKRWGTTKNGLKTKGVSAEQIAKIKSPIGIDIEAETPDEIAISILAEVIQARNA